ncbi:MAG: NAD-dependent epimerase/dehydratase family protein [Lacunisphaera sp.]|nr:NAD-dependent epimerase/dehydratase family protein [Lacunisphaera sp.]
MSTYLVTGAAGFIASKVCEMLLAEGHTVVGVDNLNDYYDVRLKDWRLSRLLGAASKQLGTDPRKSVYADSPKPFVSGRFEFHVLDIENLPALEELFATHKFGAVFNLAARAGVRASLENPEIYRSTNILGEENVLKCQVKYGVKKHVLASSSSVYAGCPMPFTEDAVLGPPQSPYAETKRQAELLARDYYLKHGIDVTVLRYFTVFGPAGRPDMAPFRFIKWIDEGTPITLYGDGTQARDFTYVDDIARGTILAGRLYGSELRATSDELRATCDQLRAVDPQSSALGSKLKAESSKLFAPSFDVINLGGGRNPITLHAIIAMIEKILGKQAKISNQPPSAADIKETWADIAKAKRILSWEPTITPEDGFRRAASWHVENQGWLRSIQT